MRGKAVKTVIIMFFFTISAFLYSNETDFVVELSEKETASYSDLVISFCYLYNLDVSENFAENMERIGEKIEYQPKDTSPGRSVTIGDFSLFAMQYLGLESGIFYLATKSGRYASRELMMRLIVPRNTSEHEVISGVELLRYIQKVVDYENQD